MQTKHTQSNHLISRLPGLAFFVFFVTISYCVVTHLEHSPRRIILSKVMVLTINNPHDISISAKKMHGVISRNQHNYIFDFSNCKIKFANGVILYLPHATIRSNSSKTKMTIEVK